MKLQTFYISLILLLSALASGVKAQLPDGTLGNSEYINALFNNLSDESNTFFDTTYNNLNVKLGLYFYIVRDKDGANNINENLIDASIIELNKYFSPIGVSFTKAKVESVNEYKYSYLVIDSIADSELFKKYAKPNKINIFLVDSISLSGLKCYGYSHFPTDSTNTNIILKKSSMSGNNLTTQMGHFFGLLSTHEVIGGSEFSDGSNCLVSGDYLCDTYASPSLLARVNSECLYKGKYQDANGSYYTPSVANLMSDGPEECKCIFTLGQYRRMYYYYNKYRHSTLSK